MEAEYVALAGIVKEVLFLRQAQIFIAPESDDYSITIMEDNEGIIKMVNNKHSSKKAQHIDVKHYAIRDAVEAGKVRVRYVETEEQDADVLTKASERNSFGKHVDTSTNVVPL